MDDATIERLTALNRRFYEDNAETFIAKRQHPWRGWRRLMTDVPAGARVLDLGCGHGRFLHFLENEHPDPQRVYLGLDNSDALLTAARLQFPDARFENADLVQDSLQTFGQFEMVVAFGLLHHVPGAQTRLDFVKRLADRVAPGGILVIALWSVDPSGKKRQPDIEGLQLDARDLLMGWGPNPGSLRYCHDVDEVEAQSLIAATGLNLQEDFREDGSGNRNRYLVLRAHLGP